MNGTTLKGKIGRITDKDVRKSLQQEEFNKYHNRVFEVILGERSNGRKYFFEQMGYKVITYKEYQKRNFKYNKLRRRR